MNIHSHRTGRLRETMSARGWDAVIVSSSDPHNSEYPAPRWKTIEWLSGFTGEAADLVITADEAGLWADSRYFIQAAAELEGSGITLFRKGLPGVPPYQEWLAGKAATVAFDGLCFTESQTEDLHEAFSKVGKQVEMVSVPDLAGDIWDGRPPIPVTPVITLSEENVGESRYSKLTDLRKYMLMQECDAVFLSALDDIAWLLNIRGSDIEYNPYVISYLLVTQSEAVWFVKKDSPADYEDTKDSYRELEMDGVTIASYDGAGDYISALSSDDGDFSVLVDPDDLNHEMFSMLGRILGPENVKTGHLPVKLRKAIKNPVEIEWMRTAFMEDGVAMENFLYWLEKTVGAGIHITEWDASQKLTSFRAAIPGYRGNSFANISAGGANAALPHYSVPESDSAGVGPARLYLVDSGGQYIFGTTDITRTVPLGECTDLEKEDYTLVLKGMIDLSMAVFPRGTAGCHLDVLARNALWSRRRNFGHGTGHGIGFYLGVHEGPQSIRQNFNPQPLLPGMITSNEPGIYRENMHGIRHENVLLCVEDASDEFGDWLAFETLTVCHIDTSAVIPDLMTADEITWLNDYNRSVFERLSGRLSPEVSDWLRVKTQPIPVRH